MAVETKAPGVEDILAFLRGRTPSRLSRAGDGREAVTSASGGLTPGERTAITKHLQHRDQTDHAVAEQAKSEKDFESPDGNIPTTSVEAQLGRVLTREQVIQRLNKLTSRLYFERSNAFPELCGVYTEDYNAQPYNGMHIRLVCSMEWGFSPEWSIPNLKAEGRKKLTRGWRDLYLKLVGYGFFSLTDAERVFDTKKSDRQSPKYQKAVMVTMRRVRERGLDAAKALGVQSPHAQNP